jgi:hypothetical protein
VAEAGKMYHLSSLVEYLEDLCRGLRQEESQHLTLAGQDVVINLEYKKTVKSNAVESRDGILKRHFYSGFWA